jgi:mono/diheme cytochrome c family protein
MAAFRLTLLLLLAAQITLLADTQTDAAGPEFFETRIRPVLVEQCYRCHSEKAEKLKGGLYLDSRDGVLKGGDTGPALVPGDPEKSLLIKAIRYTDENLQMPPKGKKLSAEQIADFEAWVKMGAPDPRTKTAAQIASDEKRKKHWAFQPVRKPELPAVTQKEWVKSPVDPFVLAKLQANGMTPSKPADRRTLIRRAAFDLTGLPPSVDEVEAFVNDSSERAWETIIDRLLASPQYGERWARHWLDVARYADTKGYVFEEERRFPYSYTYRDYVINAFNEDLPFDRFIIEQLAADLLPLGEDKRPLAAMGFLTLGRRFLNNQADIIDDRIDVVSRGLMGLTVGCARCHDHKFDPIPTKDYYSMYGVFASSSEPREKPLLGTAALPKEYPEYEAERKKREDELKTFRETKFGEVLAELRAKASEYMLAAVDAEKLDDKGKLEVLAKERKLHPIGVRRWMNFFEERRKMDKDPIFALWFAFTGVTNYEGEAKSIVEKLRSTPEALNRVIAETLGETIPGSLKDVAEIYKKSFAAVENEWAEAKKGKAEHLSDLSKEAIRDVLYTEAGPAYLSEGEIPRLFDVPTAQKNRALQRKLEELDATHPGSPPRGMVLKENSDPYKPHVFVRGNQFNQGAEVPRQFLELIAGPDRKPFQNGSGRLELAEAIASRDNPLTARVIVNRIWLNHFGAGLVKTPSDFGVRADSPTHPELLDYMAAWFMDNGWSLKKLHKLIMLSSTYQQSSDERADYAQKDSANTLLWRMNRRRLEFEPFRDTLLAVAGKLDSKEGGHPVEIATDSPAPRRTIYGFVERQNLPGIFRTFDFASPDTTSPQRFNTTVPQQALFMINSPFVIQQAQSFMKRPEVALASDPRAKITALYETALQRKPTEEEIKLSEDFLKSQQSVPPPEPPVEIWKYGYGEIKSDTLKLATFTPLPHFTGKAWQGGDKVPDSKLGWVTLTAAGGHPGEGKKLAAVRRWIAPEDCIVSISGTLEHPAESGDGVRGYIFSNRLGALGFWPVHHAKREMGIPKVEVKKGDTIDFAVESNESIDSDSFNWAPVIKTLSSGGKSITWNAKEEFSGPKEPVAPLGPWEKFAQVLLMSNEVAFVD